MGDNVLVLKVIKNSLIVFCFAAGTLLISNAVVSTVKLNECSLFSFSVRRVSRLPLNTAHVRRG